MSLLSSSKLLFLHEREKEREERVVPGCYDDNLLCSPPPSPHIFLFTFLCIFSPVMMMIRQREKPTRNLKWIEHVDHNVICKYRVCDHTPPPLYSSSPHYSITTTTWKIKWGILKKKKLKKYVSPFHRGESCLLCLFVYLFNFFFLSFFFFWSCCSPVDSLNNEATGKKIQTCQSWFMKQKIKRKRSEIFKSFVLQTRFPLFYLLSFQTRLTSN